MLSSVFSKTVIILKSQIWNYLLETDISYCLMVELGFMGDDLIKNPGPGTCWDNFYHIWYSHWSRRYQYSFWPSILFLLYHDCSFLEGIVWIHLLTICLRIRSINNCIVLYCQPVKVEKVKQTIRWNQSNVWLVHYHWHLWREMKW